jgi:hypothetical protein
MNYMVQSGSVLRIEGRSDAVERRRALSRGSVEAAAVAARVDPECKKRTTISESLDGVQVEKLISQGGALSSTSARRAGSRRFERAIFRGERLQAD